MFKNDERYWDINLLNKWFAISSVVFLITMVWTFIDDNDDEFKEYQREFRKLEIEKDESAISFVPPFARYPYEIWIAPFKKTDCANQLSDKEVISIAKLLISSVVASPVKFEPSPYKVSAYKFLHLVAFNPKS